MSAAALAASSVAAERAPVAAERAPEGTPLYVHLPFCAAKCHYCDFFSVPAQGHDQSAMVAAILREAELRAPERPRTVFLGGGTPSLLAVGELATLLDGLDRITRFRSSALEVTAECNPESLDRDKALALLDLGVGRLSIGFQSLHDDVLALFGRVHTADDSLRAFEAARAAGVRDLNVDLIYASPGQTAEQWEQDLRRVLALRPDHLSAYNLTFEEETLFRRWLEQGRIERQPEELELALFQATRRELAQHGYEAYEISNFALAGRRCAHNVNYWHNGTYVGIGPSAVSKIGGSRLGNVKAITAYRTRIETQGQACAWEESPTPRTRLAETWWLGLRLREGLSADEARSRASYEDDEDRALAVAQRSVEQGLLARTSGRFHLTERGLPLADWVARQFLATADG